MTPRSRSAPSAAWARCCGRCRSTQAGDPRAPVGSAEWAKRWRLEFQNVAKNLPHTPRGAVRFFEVGQQHRAWTLLADADGRPFVDFDAFCACPQPYGLGMEPAKFRAYLAAEMGDKAADLVTVAPGRQGERTDRETSGHHVPKSGTAEEKKAKRLRAILRAPEVVQAMYRAGQMTQADAARMGPAAPTPIEAWEERQQAEPTPARPVSPYPHSSRVERGLSP